MKLFAEQLNKLTDKHKEIIKKSFIKTCTEAGDAEFDYIENKIFKKIIIVETMKEHWIPELLRAYKTVYEIFRDHRNNAHRLSDKTFQLAGAALFYFINPYDLIFDITAQPGFLDDIYVLMLCGEMIEDENDKKLFQEKCSGFF